MRANKEKYKQVAERCSRFNSKESKDAFTNSTANHDNISCKNCVHFDDAEYCKLDLYDSIVRNHKL